MWREPTQSELELLCKERRLITMAGSFLITLIFLFPAIFGIINLVSLLEERSIRTVIELVIDLALAVAILYGKKLWKKAMNSDIDEKTLIVSEARIMKMEKYHFEAVHWGDVSEARTQSAYQVTVQLEGSNEIYVVKASMDYKDKHMVGDEVLVFGDKEKFEEKYMFLI